MSSQPPRTRPPARRVSSGSEGGNDGGSESRGRSGSSGSGGSQPPGPPRPPRRPPADNYAPPPRRDPFPYVLGGIIALLVVGVFAVVYLLSSRTGDISISATPTVVADAGPTSVTGGVVEITAQPGVTTAANDLGSDPQPTAGEPPPRMPLAEFKALYDNPAERAKMLIIDVRAKESFDAGHIEGAESWPEADIDATVVKLPKDKLIVAYCQWPAENESSRVAQKLHDTYKFNYDNLKVLLGGWNTWNQEHAKDPTGYPTGGTGAASGASDKPTVELQPAPAVTVVAP